MTIAHKNNEDYELDRILNSPEARLIAKKVVGHTLTLIINKNRDKVTGKCISAEPHRLDSKWKCFSPSQELTFKLVLEFENGRTQHYYIGSQQLI